LRDGFSTDNGNLIIDVHRLTIVDPAPGKQRSARWSAWYWVCFDRGQALAYTPTCRSRCVALKPLHMGAAQLSREEITCIISPQRGSRGDPSPRP
jgi:hypothetical protein